MVFVESENYILNNMQFCNLNNEFAYCLGSVMQLLIPTVYTDNI